jgi:hypothetical protein
MPSASYAPAASHAKQNKHTSVVTTVTPERSGIPRANGFNSFLRALPGEPGFLATVIPKKLASQELDTSVGMSGPHDFAVRSATSFVFFDAARVHRIPPHVS